MEELEVTGGQDGTEVGAEGVSKVLRRRKSGERQRSVQPAGNARRDTTHNNNQTATPGEMSRQEIGASFHSSIQSPCHHQTPEEAIRETKTWMACEEDNDDTYTDGINTFNRKEDHMVFLFLS